MSDGGAPYINVVDFQVAWAKRRAKEFTEVYVKRGKTAAAKYSRENIPPHMMHSVKVFVQEEFEKRGIVL